MHTLQTSHITGAASKRKGVVGNRGTKMPMNPKTSGSELAKNNNTHITFGLLFLGWTDCKGLLAILVNVCSLQDYKIVMQ
jgi:hypothetical protein